MFRPISLFLLVLFTNTMLGQSIPDTIVVPSSYELRKLKPFIAFKNEIIVNHTDSLFLVNKIRYNYYEKLKSIISDTSFNSPSISLIKLKQIIVQKDLQFESLAQKCSNQSKLCDTTIAKIKSSLVETDKNLEDTKNSLLSAKKSLSEAQDHLKKIQRKQWWQKLSILGGGIGVGLLVGILVN